MKIGSLVILLLVIVVRIDSISSSSTTMFPTIVERLKNLLRSSLRTEKILVKYILSDLTNKKQTNGSKIVKVFKNIKPAVDINKNGVMSNLELQNFISKVKKSCDLNTEEMFVFPALAEILTQNGPDAHLFRVRDILSALDANKDSSFSLNEVLRFNDKIQKFPLQSQSVKDFYHYIITLLFEADGVISNRIQVQDDDCLKVIYPQISESDDYEAPFKEFFEFDDQLD